MKNFLIFILGFASMFIQANLHRFYAQVNQDWVARYNGPVNGGDAATSIAVDASGNVYVTGSLYSDVTSDDFATVKYNSSGVQQWLATYNGLGNGSDQAQKIAVDGSGNVYVTGQSPGIGTGNDYATIKYSSSGVQQWAARYNGPGNNEDWARSLVIDGSGNVYVTGYSNANATNPDYATIKYDANGVQQWVARYDAGQACEDAKAIAIDNSGNVYVTGHSCPNISTSSDWATIKYNSSGVQQWVSRFNAPGSQSDQAFAIAVDILGNVYATGNGWGGGITNYYTVKYNSSGVQQWVMPYHQPGGPSGSAGKSIAVDNSGNLYVTGWSPGIGTGFDYATIKYGANGVQQWVAIYNGPGNADDLPASMVLDASGNVYVTGYSPGIGTNTDYATIKYSSSGVQQWVQRYNGPGDSVDNAYSIVLDGSGNVYVTGSSTGSGTGFDFATIKYSQYYSVSGLVTYRDNNQPITQGYVKALKYDIVSGRIITIDSTQVQTDGRYDLPRCPQDSLDIMVYQNDEDYLNFVPTYYISTIDWHQAKTIYPTNNLDSINILAFRIENHLNPFSISGGVFDKNSGSIKDAIIYAKIGNSFKNFAFTNFSGSYDISNLPPGNYELVENRIGYSNAVNLVTITSSSLSSVNFYITNSPSTQLTPEDYLLYQNYPNPFNPLTTIEFDLPDLPEESNGLHSVTLKLYNITGREVATLIDKELYPGKYEVIWNGRDNASGVYFCKLIVISPANSSFRSIHLEETRKLVLLK